jgi:hypothetical protein
MDRTDRCCHASLAHHLGDPVDCRLRQRRDVLGMVDREIGGMPGLVRCQRAAGDLAQDFLAERVDAKQVGIARFHIVQKTGNQLAITQMRVKRAVFADDCVNRPQTSQNLRPRDASPVTGITCSPAR